MNIPSSTYRLQFSQAFPFEKAGPVTEYLKKLGISHIYASPIFKARRGSSHGYDVVDPREINPELGGEAAFGELLRNCEKNGIGWIQDIVPNHMALSAENPFIVDVIENGPLSRYYAYFDIDWNHPYKALNGRILIPVLGRSFGKCLESGELQLRFDSSGIHVAYYDHRFPLRMESYAEVFGRCIPELRELLGDADQDLLKFLGVLYTVKNLPGAGDLGERYEQIGFVKTMLWEIYRNNDIIREQCDRVLGECNGDNGEADPWRSLEKVLESQYFRLTFWKTATEELNYRRFFTINDLIAVRVEDDKVFTTTHQLVFDLIVTGRIQGVRIDHVDGLFDPASYCAQLRTRAPESYIVVEKILGRGEELPATWPVQGTTGYDFLNIVNQLYCDRRGKKVIDQTYAAVSEEDCTFAELIAGKKRLIIGRHMAGDIDNLALRLKMLAGLDRRGVDITMYGLRRALVELLTFFPVYRTYVDEYAFHGADVAVLKRALDAARAAQVEYVPELDYIESFLGIDAAQRSERRTTERRRFIMQLQQFTSPLLAKGIEDTALYSYNRLVSLNEVGGYPDLFGIGSDEFHRFCSLRASRWPHSMNTTATHDTKRGEGTRARINVLSELEGEWAEKVELWHMLNGGALSRDETGRTIPVMNDEYLYYQTLVGSFPFPPVDYEEYRTRIGKYMIKAVREAKEHSSWIRPHEEYERALLRFVNETLPETGENPFLAAFIPFQSKVAWYGMLNSLSQTVLKLTAPGVPDFYQGSELWDFSLVDPDNRQPVDFDLRGRMIDDLAGRGREPEQISDLMADPRDGRIKMLLIMRLCALRRRMHALFTDGKYLQLEVSGRWSESVTAFMRCLGESAALVVAPRLMTRIVTEGRFPTGREIWGDTSVLLPPDRSGLLWTGGIVDQEIQGGGSLLVGDLLGAFPVTVHYHQATR